MNDGGYAVMDYCQVNPELGTMDDLENLATALRSHNMSLCIDLVVNHTAKEHEWAKRAMAGEQKYLDYYFTFDDHTAPDAYDATLPEVFPDMAPGNFTFYPEMAGTGKWVWTTFNEYQWDLDYHNPAVFREMLDYMLFLANKGVDILRLDAVPFMWKRLGTNCQNQPEVHELLQAFRALVRMVAPSVIFKAEAIVAPQDLLPYLGVGQHIGKECELAYHNSLMVLLWSTLASTKVALMTYTLRQMPPTPTGTTWVTYIRLHDDIGWAITDENAAAVGENGFLHRRFLNEYYSGDFPDSPARGEVFQFNPNTGDGRMSGTTASLAGLEKALQDHDQTAIETALKRILLIYSVIFSYGGIPLIYMGDEIALLNDYSYRQDPIKAQDNRWLHRPKMPWELTKHLSDPTTLEGHLFKAMEHLLEIRCQTNQLHSAASVTPLWTDNQHIFAYLRQHPAYGQLLALCNFSEQPQSLTSKFFSEHGLETLKQDICQNDTNNDKESKENNTIKFEQGRLTLQPYQFMWLVEPES
jgi:amylosucrase